MGLLWIPILTTLFLAGMVVFWLAVWAITRKLNGQEK